MKINAKTKCCKLCGEAFVVSKPSKVYCSRSCSVKAANDRRKQLHTKECKYCGCMFESKYKSKTICSEECRKAIKNDRRRGSSEDRTCPCGAVFSATVGTLKKYCSPKCKPRATQSERSCQCCGQLFTPKTKDARFCTRGCYHEHLRANPRSQECCHCGEEFESKGDGAKYCSSLCSRRSSHGYPATRDCSVCGSSYPFRRGSVCSDACRHLAREESLRKYQSKPEVKLVNALRRRLAMCIEREPGQSISGTNRELIGCEPSELREHIEQQFQPGMTWDNHSIDGWHIDHILPCSSFDLTDKEQQKKCFHYTNLQPLWAKDNLSKSDKLNWELAAV